MSKLAIECSGLSKSFGSNVVLKNIDLSVNEGSLLALNEDVGFVSENFEYKFPTNLRGLIKIVSRLHNRWDSSLFETIAAKFRLPLDGKYRDLSRGQKMQFAFALTCAKQPKILILDEITAVLDPTIRLHTMIYLKEFCSRGGTVVLATNILSEVQNFADRLVILNNGSIGFDQPVAQFGNMFVKLRRKAQESPFIHQDCKEVGINSDGSVSYLLPREALAQLERPAPEDLRGITSEDLFIYYTQKAS